MNGGKFGYLEKDGCSTVKGYSEDPEIFYFSSYDKIIR
jgi:hypothetical protein